MHDFSNVGNDIADAYNAGFEEAQGEVRKLEAENKHRNKMIVGLIKANVELADKLIELLVADKDYEKLKKSFNTLADKGER